MIKEAQKVLMKPKPVAKPKKKSQSQIFELPSKNKNRKYK